MKLFKVVLKVEGYVDLNDSSVQETVLNNVSLILPLGDLRVNSLQSSSSHVNLYLSTVLL